jgi:hypothetical protein
MIKFEFKQTNQELTTYYRRPTRVTVVSAEGTMPTRLKYGR